MTATDYESPYPLGADKIAAFRRDGFVLIEQLLPREQALRARTAIVNTADAHNPEDRPLSERDTYGKAFLQTFNLWRLDDAVRAFVLARRFARVAAELMGVDRVRLYHDQALFKEPGGGSTPWHRDKYYWPLDTDDMITLWMPLVDVTPDMGMMQFAPGSHLDPGKDNYHISDESDVFYTHYIGERGLTVAGPGSVRAGDATFHAGWTLHRATGNRTDSRREVMTVIYYADGARVLDPVPEGARDDLEAWLANAEPGSVAACELNPLLWNAG